MKRVRHWLMAFVMAAGIVSSAAVPALAYTGDPGQAGEAAAPLDGQSTETVIPEQEAAGQTEGTPQGEAQGEETPFSIPGNGEVLDDKQEDGTKEFLDETKTEETPQVVIPETEAPEETGTESETGSEPVQPEEDGGMNTGALLAVGVLAAGAIGAGYYFKVVKPKKEESQETGEDLEFYDGGPYVNEDQPEPEDSAEKENNEA